MMTKKTGVIGIIIAVIVVFVLFSNGSVQFIKTKTSVEDISKGVVSESNYQEQSIIPIKGRYITEYQLPTKSGPNSILVDTHGIVWTVGSYSHKLYRLDPKTDKLTQFQIPGENDNLDLMSWSMLQDDDGFIWFTQFGPIPLWRFDPTSEQFLAFHFPSSSPFQMKYNSKTDEIWFTTLSDNMLGVVQKIKNDTTSVNGYKISEFAIGDDSYPSGLTFQGDFVWTTELEKGKIAKFDVIRKDSGEVVGIRKILEIPVTNGSIFSSPTDILFTNNRTAWVNEHGPSTITRYYLPTHYFTRLPTAQNKYHVASLPFWLRKSLDGNGIWFNEHEGGSIAFLDTNNMTLSEFELPTNATEVVFMLNLALDPQNVHRAWFSEWNLDKIGMVDLGVTEPFEIKSDVNKITFDAKQGKKDASVDFEVIKNNDTNYKNNNEIFLNITSSMEPDGTLENMTYNFSQNTVDITQINQSSYLNLGLHDQSLLPGNYTLGISAGNGLICKTIFQKLVVR